MKVAARWILEPDVRSGPMRPVPLHKAALVENAAATYVDSRFVEASFSGLFVGATAWQAGMALASHALSPWFRTKWLSEQIVAHRFPPVSLPFPLA